MTYGFTLSNTSGRVMFSTEDNIPVLIAPSSVSVASTSTRLPSTSVSEFLMVRPQDGESGVIGYSDGIINGVVQSGSIRDIASGFTSVVDGYKYSIAKSISADYSPATSGYGIEVYDSSSNLIYTDNATDLVEISLVGETNDSGFFVYQNPPGEDFNELYVLMDPLLTFSLAGIGIPFVSGTAAYFDASREAIIIRASRINGNDEFPWDTRWYDSGVTSIANISGLRFVIMRRR